MYRRTGYQVVKLYSALEPVSWHRTPDAAKLHRQQDDGFVEWRIHDCSRYGFLEGITYIQRGCLITHEEI